MGPRPSPPLPPSPPHQPSPPPLPSPPLPPSPPLRPSPALLNHSVIGELLSSTVPTGRPKSIPDLTGSSPPMAPLVIPSSVTPSHNATSVAEPPAGERRSLSTPRPPLPHNLKAELEDASIPPEREVPNSAQVGDTDGPVPDDPVDVEERAGTTQPETRPVAVDPSQTSTRKRKTPAEPLPRQRVSQRSRKQPSRLPALALAASGEAPMGAQGKNAGRRRRGGGK
jgi:hypothetical protein